MSEYVCVSECGCVCVSAVISMVTVLTGEPHIDGEPGDLILVIRTLK